MGALRSRPLALLICLFVLLSSIFVIQVNAASDNLVNSNLTQWHNIEGASTVQVYGNGNVYRLNATGGSVGLFNGLVYDLPSFVAGHSYTLKFKLPSAVEIAEAYNVSFSDSQLISYYNNAEISVGYGFLSADGSRIISPVNLFTFNSSNISRYVGTNLSTTFVAGSASGRPCIYIELYSSDGNLHLFYFSNFVLFDNDDNSAELTGIKGFLHSIRWDLVGGVCEEEDCPHSSNVNPHLSLTQRMTAGFSSLLENIGNKFEDGSTLNIWFNDLSSGVSSLGDRFNTFITGLGDRISGFFDNLKEGIFSKFDSLGIDLRGWFSDVGSWFDDLSGKLKGWFDDTVSSIDTFFNNLWDKFDKLFDKFKPRVYERFQWRRGIVNWSTGEVTLRDDNYPYVIVTDLFTVSPGTKYLIDYIDSDITQSVAIYKYDYYGNYIGALAYTNSFEGMELESGFQYRFRTNFTPGSEDTSAVNDYVLVYADEGWINALVHVIQNFFKGCFNLVIYFDWYGDYENPFLSEDKPISLISGYLTEIDSYVEDTASNFEAVIDSVTGSIYLFDEFVQRFDWLFMIVVVSLLLIVVTRFIGL